MRQATLAQLLLIPVLSLPALAWAHAGHGGHESVDGFIAGALHPLTGLDHLLGILAAGVLLGWLPRDTRWLVCAGFLGLLGATHALWLPEVGAGFIPGLLASSAGLIAVGMVAVGMIDAAQARRALRPPHG